MFVHLTIPIERKMFITIKTIDELNYWRDNGHVSKGTYQTGRFAIEQGKPLFLCVPDGKI